MNRRKRSVFSKARRSIARKTTSVKRRSAEWVSFKLAKKVTSLYIDDHEMKVVVAKGRQVLKHVELPLEPGLVKDGEISNPAVMAPIIRRLFDDNKLTKNTVVIGMSGLHCLSRVLVLPRLSEQELSEAVTREAERELPVPMESIYLSWQVVETTDKDMKVFLIAYTRSMADALVKTLREARMKAYVFDLAPLAVARVPAMPTAVVADVRAQDMDIVLLDRGVPEFLRSLHLPHEGNTQDRLLFVGSEIQRTVKFFESNRKQKDKAEAIPIIVAGGFTADPKVMAGLTAVIGSPVQPLPLPFVFYNGAVPASYAVNAGLSLKKAWPRGWKSVSLVNINALPDIYRPAKPSVFNMVAIPAAIAAVAIIAVTSYLFVQNSASAATIREDAIRAQSIAGNQQATSLSMKRELARADQSLDSATQTLGNLNDAQARFASQRDVINGDSQLALSLLPGDIRLTGLYHDGGQLRIDVNSASEGNVLAYARALEASGRFTSLGVAYANVEPGQVKGINFELVLYSKGQ